MLLAQRSHKRKQQLQTTIDRQLSDSDSTGCDVPSSKRQKNTDDKDSKRDVAKPAAAVGSKDAEIAKLNATCANIRKACKIVEGLLEHLKYDREDVKMLLTDEGHCYVCYDLLSACTTCRCRKCNIVAATCDCECFACGSKEPISCSCTPEEEDKAASKKLVMLQNHLLSSAKHKANYATATASSSSPVV